MLLPILDSTYFVVQTVAYFTVISFILLKLKPVLKMVVMI